MAEGRCIDTEPVCLADGRRLMPGSEAHGIDAAHPENQALVEDGRLLILAPDLDVAAATVDAVMQWVGGNPDRAGIALAGERARPDSDQRRTLVDKLEQLVAAPQPTEENDR